MRNVWLLGILVVVHGRLNETRLCDTTDGPRDMPAVGSVHRPICRDQHGSVLGGSNCSSAWCTSPNKQTATSCWDEQSGEGCICDRGSARLMDKGAYDIDGEASLYLYACCETCDGTAQRERLWWSMTGGLVANGLGVCTCISVSACVFMCCQRLRRRYFPYHDDVGP